MMKVSLAVLALLAVSLAAPASAGRLLLAEKGKAIAAIVVPTDASIAEKTAGTELAAYLKQVTGAEFDIVTSAAETQHPTRIYLGQTETVKRLMPQFDFSKLRHDGIVIRRKGNDLILSGDRPRGTLYAVYTFLEDTIGCKWWTSDADYIPNLPILAVEVKNLVYTPTFRCRETFYKRILNQNTEFAARLKFNGHFQPIKPELGGHYNILGFCHTFYQLIPPDKYFADHPEWFSEMKGKRMNGYFQLCLTNEEMRKELTKNALGWIKANPDAGIISVSQSDAFGWCECAKCTALTEQTGSHSGAIIWFVNKVAEEIEKDYPDFLVETLAYLYTRNAPTNISPRKNVVVRLCSIECDFAKPLTASTNKTFYRDIKAWQAIAPNLYVWDYTVGFGNLMMPNPNFRVLAPNIRLFAKSSVIGMFEQGDGYNPDCDFAAMKAWMFGHLLWNPKLDESKLMNEFLNGYYGAAGPYMRQYIDLICDAVGRSGQRLTWANTDFTYLTPEVLIQAMKIFSSAEAAIAGDTELERRLSFQKAGLQLALVLAEPAPGLPKGKELERMCEQFLDLYDSTGNNHFQEGQQLTDAMRAQLKEKAAGKRFAIIANATRAETMKGYSDAETFAEMKKTMTEIWDIPKDGWKFIRDKADLGLKGRWYRTDFDDSQWWDLSIAKFWEEQIGNYDGVGWYRKMITPPSVEAGKRIFLVFGAVDDSARIWLNGAPLGDYGPGWDQSFAADVTKALKPGQENLLVVRVMDEGGFGGIWKSVKLMVK